MDARSLGPQDGQMDRESYRYLDRMEPPVAVSYTHLDVYKRQILGSMGGLFMLGMLTKRANSGGAIIGIVASIIVQLFVARFQTFHLLLYTASGFISCFVIGYLASLFFKKK